MEAIIRTLAHYVALAAEGLAVGFIVLGLLLALWDWVRDGLIRRRTHLAMVEMRNDLGHMLSLSLEFLIGADVLRTAVSPTWEEIGKLGAIVGIRTVLNFFLVLDLKHFGERERARPRVGSGAAPEE